MYGVVDKELHEWQQLLLPVLKELHERYDDQSGSIHGSAEENRRRKIIGLYRDLVAERGFWYELLCSVLDGPENLNTQEVPAQAIEYLSKWLPDDTCTVSSGSDEEEPQRPETVNALCHRRLSKLSGLSQQTVKNALKRHRAKIRRDE